MSTAEKELLSLKNISEEFKIPEHNVRNKFNALKSELLLSRGAMLHDSPRGGRGSYMLDKYGVQRIVDACKDIKARAPKQKREKADMNVGHVETPAFINDFVSPEALANTHQFNLLDLKKFLIINYNDLFSKKLAMKVRERQFMVYKVHPQVAQLFEENKTKTDAAIQLLQTEEPVVIEDATFISPVTHLVNSLSQALVYLENTMKSQAKEIAELRSVSVSPKVEDGSSLLPRLEMLEKAVLGYEQNSITKEQITDLQQLVLFVFKKTKTPMNIIFTDMYGEVSKSTGSNKKDIRLYSEQEYTAAKKYLEKRLRSSNV